MPYSKQIENPRDVLLLLAETHEFLIRHTKILNLTHLLKHYMHLTMLDDVQFSSTMYLNVDLHASASSIDVTFAKCAVLGIPRHRIP